MKERCYLCGATDNLTRDHVPPVGFFPPPLPNNLITVPCCQKCHEPLKMDDEAFRVWISCATGCSDAGAWIFKHKTLGSSLQRSPRLREHVQRSMGIGLLNFGDEIVEVPTITIPADRPKKFLTRTTKALLATFHPDYDYANDTFRMTPVAASSKNFAVLDRIVAGCVRDSRGNEVFDFWRNIQSDNRAGVWIFIFYTAACFIVAHTSNPKDWDA